MTLVKQDIDLPLGEGVQEGVAGRLLDAPKVATLVDCRLDKRGEVVKRYGATSLGTTGLSSSATPSTVLSHRGGLVQLTSEGLYSYDATDGRWNRTNAAGPRPSIVTTDPVVRGNGSYVDGDVAYDPVTGVVIVVSHDRRREVVSVTAIEAATGAVITTRGTVPAVIKYQPKIVCINSKFVVFGRDANWNISAASYDATVGDFAFGSAVTVHTAAGTETDYDVHADSTYAHCAVARPAAVVGWTCYQVTTVPSVTASISPVSGRAAQSIAVHAVPGYGIYVLFYDTFPTAPTPDQISLDIFDTGYTSISTSPAKVMDVNLTGLPPLTPPYRVALTAVANGDLWCFASNDRGNGRATGVLLFRLVDNGGATVTDTGQVPNLVLATRAITDSANRAIVGVARDVTYELADAFQREPQPSGFLVTPQSVESWEIDPVNPKNPPTKQAKQWLSVLGRFGRDVITMRGGSGTGQTDRHTSAIVNVNGALRSAYTVGVAPSYDEGRYDRFGVDLLSAVTSPGRVRSTEAESLTVISTGELQCYDGARHTELSIPVQPHRLDWDSSTVSSALGTDTTAAGVGLAQGDYASGMPSWGSSGTGHYQWAIHRYKYCFRWVDSRGNVHRSGMSEEYSIGRLVDRSDVNPADFVHMDRGASGYTNHNRVFLVVKPSPTALSGEDDVRIQVELYRRPVEFVEYQVVTGPANDVETNREIRSHGDTTYRLVGVLDIGEIANNPCLGWIQDPLRAVGFGDLQDASAPSPYTDSGELSSEAIGPTLDVCSTQQRMFAVDGEDRLRVYYTKPFAKGYAPEWNAALTLRCASEGGDLVACETLDDKLLLFKQSRIYVTPVFAGPDALGNGTSFDAPREMASDVGCINRSSIAKGPFGVCFQSQRGIYLVGRDLSLTWVGEAVRDSLVGRTIRAATVVPAANEVRWLLDTNDALVWEYRLNQWMTYDSVPATDSCLWLDRWTRVLSTRTVRYESNSTYDSGDGRPRQEIVTSWVKLAGLQGFQRITRAMLLGEYTSGHLQVEIGYDYETAWTDTHQFTEAQLLALGSFQLQFTPSRQKCQAIRFRIRELLNLGELSFTTGAGFKLQGLRLRVGIKPGPFRRVAAAGRR